ncbi:unnamed protein product [Rotaria sp. Silwood1]|nr:unnamed protein product [Rotaria sp. Silwood1]CAF0859684.1 unnamed protein product [Rotaria sp. Silwood1]CAF3379078.1 unnamed protein product [Rotaria sp. Silwood1]CAF4542553.1 unnamed protein product [Rotaria sp. Silwood1]CAF4557969.1 unnamed protein product [Rotaria sp. Silwood1]
MHKSNEDCFYFLTSSCAKGSSCTYRHSPLALTCNIICPAWLHGNCPDSTCPYRHSTALRPTITNGILCFYENTAMGCLKLDCTFIHSRPRMNLRNTSTIRPSSTNLIKKDATKPLVNNTLSTGIQQTKPVPSANINSSQPTINETQVVIPISTIKSSSNSHTPLPILKTETIARRTAASLDIDQSNENKNLSNNTNNNNTNNILSLNKSTRSVITDSPKTIQEEVTTPQSRLVVNRNVVIAETNCVPNRKIVRTTLSSSPTSSNRVVVSSDSINSSEKDKKTDIDLIGQENDAKKIKQDSQSTVDILFPCSTSSITNRLFMSSKETTSTNDTKPIRLNRDRLPAAKLSSGNSHISVSTPTNEEKTSAGLTLLQDDDRRTMRIERFQKKPISPPRSIICSTSITAMNSMNNNSSTSRNVITSSANERKRTVSKTTEEDAPPSKRISTSLSQHQSSLRQEISSLNTSTPSTSLVSSHDKNSEKQTEKFGVKISERKNSSSITMVPGQPVASSSVRPRFTPQTIVSSSLQLSSSTKTNTRLSGQPTSVAIKRPLAPMMTSETSTKSIEPMALNVIGNKNSPSIQTNEPQSSNISNQDDENKLLKPTESSDVVDTFALIDEALLEADHLLELL